LLNPLFTPAKVNELAKGVRETAIDLIDRIAGNKQCEFMEAFGRPFPITVFMRLLGLPLEQAPQFLKWEEDLLHSDPTDIQTKANAAREIRDYLRTLAASRRADPREDLASFVVQASIDNKPLSDDEILGIYYLFFVGGLDTVAATLGFIFHWLATHPEEQASLRADPSKHTDAIEEFLRAFSVVITRRRVTTDTKVAGVEMKAGDWVTVPLMMAGLDAADYPNPLELKLDRSPNRHMAFAFGPHRCIGSNLARREFSVALVEWFARIPPFRLKAGTQPTVHGGGVFGVERLELEWD
jgi:cytochrome P450